MRCLGGYLVPYVKEPVNMIYVRDDTEEFIFSEGMRSDEEVDEESSGEGGYGTERGYGL